MLISSVLIERRTFILELYHRYEEFPKTLYKLDRLKNKVVSKQLTTFTFLKVLSPKEITDRSKMIEYTSSSINTTST